MGSVLRPALQAPAWHPACCRALGMALCLHVALRPPNAVPAGGDAPGDAHAARAVAGWPGGRQRGRGGCHAPGTAAVDDVCACHVNEKSGNQMISEAPSEWPLALLELAYLHNCVGLLCHDE